MIGEVLTRCGQISGVDEVVCAIPRTSANDVLEKTAKEYAEVFRGDEHNVLARYRTAAIKFGADIIVRITGDCPLLSPELCSEIVATRSRTNADYASNLEPRTFPQGFDCEVFTYTALFYGKGPDEHVTTWMRRSSFIKRVNVRSPWPMDGRLTLDTEDDYKVICAAFGHEPALNLRAA